MWKRVKGKKGQQYKQITQKDSLNYPRPKKDQELSIRYNQKYKGHFNGCEISPMNQKDIKLGMQWEPSCMSALCYGELLERDIKAHADNLLCQTP